MNFSFDVDEMDDDDFGYINSEIPRISLQKSVLSPYLQPEPISELSLTELLENLPPMLSFSPFIIPVSSNDKVVLFRRDLFDARFQLMSSTPTEDNGNALNQEVTSNPDALKFIDAPSDLVPGVYEGGLKTWECSLDLVHHLHEYQTNVLTAEPQWPVGKQILEIGCGTAAPTLYLLQQLFSFLSSGIEPTCETVLHVQDFNRSVLELVTLPNILLTWYNSPLSVPYRESLKSDASADYSDTMSELLVTPELLSAFLSCLSSIRVSIRLFAGSWEGFTSALQADASPLGDAKYDIVLTSETVYQAQSLPALVTVLQLASSSSSPQVPKSLSTADIHSEVLAMSDSSAVRQCLCLVAAKVLYFGVGGGTVEFERVVMDAGGAVECVWEKKVGVGRKILRVAWV